MNAGMLSPTIPTPRPQTVLVAVCCAVLACASAAFAGGPAPPTISKVFTPNTIGPGNVSTITITITNVNAAPMVGLSFTDTLPVVPGSMTLADPANASTTCDLAEGSLDAPDGGTAIVLTDARLGSLQTCTVTVDVTASTPGAHTNPAITLNSAAGTSVSLPVDLTVVTSLPGFSKSFSPSSVSLGGRSTLTFTIDNTLGAAKIGNLDFTDTLPGGMVVADPANAFTDCISPGFQDTTLTAVSGSGIVTLDADGTTFLPGSEVLPAGAICTVTVDVTGTGIGRLDNVTDDLLADFVSAGGANASLEVSVTPLAITKTFTDDPVPPGSVVTLDFEIFNFDRTHAAIGVGFTDDLDSLSPAPMGLTFDSLLFNDCGGSVTGTSGGTLLALAGGDVAAQGSCRVSVSLAVPAAAVPGAYENTTSPVVAMVGLGGVVGNAASDTLYVEPVPILTQEFLEVGTLAADPVVQAGDEVVLRYTVTNSSSTSMARDLEFLDELTDGSGGFTPNPTSGFLPFPVSVTLPPVPNPPCGGGSLLAPLFIPIERFGLQFMGGALAAQPGPGESCTFDVTVTIPAELPPGLYTNITEEVTATVDGATRIGKPASDSLTIVAAPRLSKVFIDDPVAPGGSATLELTLELSPNSPTDATAISFTDDLAAALTDLTAILPPTPDPPCGVGSSLTGSASNTFLTFAGGTLAAGESCTFSVPVSVPGAAPPGNYTSTTSEVGATVLSTAVTSPAASDVLDVSGLDFTKEFVGDPVFPGETVTLKFTLENVHPTDDATAIAFDDELADVLPGGADLTATLPPAVDTCGGSMSGPTSLSYSGGSVLAGNTCTIEFDVLVPGETDDGMYGNVTSILTATQSGGGIAVDPASDVLAVDSERLQLTKAFTDDPVAPGGSVTMELILTNLDTSEAASSIGFTHELDQVMPDLLFDSVLFDDCGGTVMGTGGILITVSGVSLAATGSCTLRVSLTVPGSAVAGSYVSTTNGVTGTINSFAATGSRASDSFDVAQILTFGKSFDGPTVAAGSATLTYTLHNPGPETANSIRFADDLDAALSGLVATGLPSVPCGVGSSLTGVGLLAFSGGELAPMSTCIFEVTVLVPAATAAGLYPSTSTPLSRNGLAVSTPAAADLQVEPAPTFSKAFAVEEGVVDVPVTLTFTIDNTVSALAAASLDFTDNLPAGLVVANPANGSTTCTGGTLTADPGTSAITYTDGGSVAAGASCTVQADVVAATPGTYVNTTGDLTSSSGNSGTAQDVLTVDSLPLFADGFESGDTLAWSSTVP